MLHLARALYDAWRASLGAQGVEVEEDWTDLDDEERTAWEGVAEKAKELIP